MKQSLYEKIKTIVEAGQIAICQFGNGDYILFSSMFYRGEGKTPYIRSSHRTSDIDNCHQSLGTSYETRYNIDKLCLKYIGIYERPLWRPKVGDRVQLLKKCPEYTDRVGNVRLDNEKDVFVVADTLGLVCQLYGDRKEDIVFNASYDCIAPRVSPDE